VSHDSSVGIVTRLWARWLGFDSWQELGIFLFVITFRLTVDHSASYQVDIGASFSMYKVARTWSWL